MLYLLLAASAVFSVMEDSAVRKVASRVEHIMLSNGFDTAGYSKGDMPSVVIADCNLHPALKHCKFEGSYSAATRTIVIDSQIGDCFSAVLYFEMTRDLMRVVGISGKERETATGVGEVASMESGPLCSGRVTWFTRSDKRMGIH